MTEVELSEEQEDFLNWLKASDVRTSGSSRADQARSPLSETDPTSPETRP